MEVHSYVMGVTRLADRRGLLTGDLSPVQEWMLRTLLLHEASHEIQRAESARFDQVRAAMLPLNPYNLSFQQWFENLYPDFFHEPNEVVVVEEVTQEDLDDPTGEWNFQQSEMTQQEIEEVLSSLGQSATMTLADLDADEGWV